MTLVGKIFTVLIFIMSLVFMTLSVMVFATHLNWREQVESTDASKPGYKRQLEFKTAALAAAKAEQKKTADQLALEQASRRQALAALQTRLLEAQNQLAIQEQQMTALQGALKTVTESEKLAQERLKNYEAEIQTVRKETQQAQLDRDTQFAKVVELTDRLNQGEVKLIAMEERGNQLNSQLAAYKMVMTAHGWDPTTPVSDIPPVNLTGLVLVVTDKDLVEISLGKDDGLREGHIMQIYRGDTYIGQIRIMKVAPDRAVGQIDKDLKRGQVRKGDHVTTKFS